MTVRPGARPRFSDFELETLVDETLREGVERCPFAVDSQKKLALLSTMVDAGLREFVVGCGPENPEVISAALAAKLERGELPPDTKFVFLVLLNSWETSYENFRSLPREYVKDITFSFGMIDRDSENHLLERVVDKFVGLGAESLKASILNNFSREVGEDRYADIVAQVDRCRRIGIPTIRINDSLGQLYPEATAVLASNLVADYPELNMCLHAHNDNGLGLANALTSVYWGFNMIEGSLSGYGNRVGLPATEPLVRACQDKNIRVGGEQIDLPRLVEATHLAERTYLAVPDIYRPVSGQLAGMENLGVLNIPDYLGAKERSQTRQEYFLNDVGLHPDTVIDTLRHFDFDEEYLQDERFVDRVLDQLSIRLAELYASLLPRYEQLTSSIESFYQDGIVTAEEMKEIAVACAAETELTTSAR